MKTLTLYVSASQAARYSSLLYDAYYVKNVHDVRKHSLPALAKMARHWKEPFFLFHFPFSSDPRDSFAKISERCAKKCLKKVAFLAHSEPPRPDQELSLHQSAIA
jgi:hypothetical protein